MEGKKKEKYTLDGVFQTFPTMTSRGMSYSEKVYNFWIDDVVRETTNRNRELILEKLQNIKET